MKPKGTKNKEVKGLHFTYPASGFQNDAVRLLQKFVDTKSIRFEDFTGVWRDSNFSLIYLGRNGIREHREFVEEAFKILLKYIMPPYNLQVRVGGVYLLYSMYYTQRMKPKRRIRIPLSCWPNLCELQQEVLEQKHLDAAYIIRKLICDRAFMLCAYPSMLSVDEVYLHEEADSVSSGDNAFAKSDGLGEAYGLLAQIREDDNIGQLHAVHEKYHQLKCEFNALGGGSADSPGSSLNLIKPDIANSILDIISNKAVETQKETSPKGEKSDLGINPRAEKIKSLKDAALSSKVGSTGTRYRKALKKTSPEKADSQPVTASGFIIRKRGRPCSKFPDVKKPVLPVENEEQAEDIIAGSKFPPNEPRKEKRTWNFNPTDEDYEPEVFVGDTPVRKQPRRQSRMRKSIEGSTEEDTNSDEDSSEPKKPEINSSSLDSEHEPVVSTPSRRHSRRSKSIDDGAEEEKQSDISTRSENSGRKRSKSGEPAPGTFVALRPDGEDNDCPIIGKVVVVEPDSLKVIFYKGGYDIPWIPITASSEDSEGKPLVEKISRENVIVERFTLSKTGKLPQYVKTALKKAMKKSAQ